MKKYLFGVAASAIAVLLVGCSTLGVHEGFAATMPSVIFSRGTQGGATEPNLEVLKRPYKHLSRVSGEASQVNVLVLVTAGDASIESAQKDALLKVQGADTLINRNFDIRHFSLFSIFTIATLRVTGDAIKFTDH